MQYLCLTGMGHWVEEYEGINTLDHHVALVATIIYHNTKAYAWRMISISPA